MGEEHTRIVVNGQEYHSVEEMPPEVRALYELALGLGARQGQLTAASAAEQAEGTTPAPGSAGATTPPSGPTLPAHPGSTHVTVNKVSTTRKFVVNGQEYASLDELPPELAEKVKQAMGAAGAALPDAAPAPVAHPARAVRPETRIPNFDAPRGARVRVRISALRLMLWIAAILIIFLLYLRKH